ncbi:hypothetical protein GCM10009551_081960 [Nocardiopsis tropica]|uniref:hypothetical protein n=1 Tax=Tsukamurella TaxID=2060 RepID=UPI001C7D6F46|nr:hypothetical protein [Tsukamurella sp. TY48]GIZ95563.1 hypothetical protein TTY48_01750 [Tsukamurella sp. TY48]
MTTMKKMIGSTLLGVTVIGGAGSVAAGMASAAPSQPGVGVTQPGKPAANAAAQPRPGQVPARAMPQNNGGNPNWRPGPVFHQSAWRTPIWDAKKNHWGFWLGPAWIPVG